MKHKNSFGLLKNYFWMQNMYMYIWTYGLKIRLLYIVNQTYAQNTIVSSSPNLSMVPRKPQSVLNYTANQTH